MFRLANVSITLVIILMLSACANSPREFPAPSKHNYTKAQIADFSNIRLWGDEPPAKTYIDGIVKRLQTNLPNHPEWRQRADILALSGGGDDGAYGAGFLKGWTEHGSRPEFLIVTGISTGALIAPFAFLGSKYDKAIERFYTETSQKNIFVLTPINALFGGAAVGDTAPLKKIIREEINSDLVKEIAEQSRRGRLLLIGTTNLDAQRLVIWDIGRIAESGHPNSAKLIGDIILASASIPGAFPPVMIDVNIDGKRRQEAHVDGGVTTQVFTYPIAVDTKLIRQRIGGLDKQVRNLWLIRNTKLTPEYDVNKLNVPDIAQRSISTLIKYQSMGDLIRIGQLAKRDCYQFNLTYVPESFDFNSNGLFDPQYMNALYQVGYQAGLSGKAWETDLGKHLKSGENKSSLKCQ